MGLGVRLNLSQLWYLLCNSQLYSPLRYCYNARYLPDWSIGSRADRGQGLIPLRDLPYRFVQLLSVESGSLLVRHSCRIQRLRDKQASGNFGFLLRVAVEPLWKLKTQYNENYCWPNQYINWISRIPGSATVQTLSRALYMSLFEDSRLLKQHVQSASYSRFPSMQIPICFLCWRGPKLNIILAPSKTKRAPVLILTSRAIWV